MKRMLAWVLILCMMGSSMTAWAEGDTSTDLPPIASSSEEVKPTEEPAISVAEPPAPTAVPTEEAIAEPVTPAPTAVPTEEATAEPTPPAPTAVPTEAATAEPTPPAPTVVPTEEVTAEPTPPAPTAIPTEEATAEPVPSASTAVPATEPPVAEDVWDETICDHMNPRCVQAPVCEIAGCTHLGQDVHGLDTPLCALGMWLIEQQESMAGKARTVRRLTIDLNVGDAVIWRSGRYTITGGDKRKASVTVADHRTVVLEMKETVLDSLTLGGKVEASFTVGEASVIHALRAGEDTNVTFQGPAPLTIDEASLPKKQGQWGQTRVVGGSLKTVFDETDDRICMAFDAAGATAALVEGKSYPLSSVHENGKAYLWLPVPDAGYQWQATVAEKTLTVVQVAASVPTGTPEVTDTPEATDVPEVTGTPEATDVPEVTASPEPTSTPHPDEEHLVLTVVDGAGKPVANQALTVRIGDTLLECTTDDAGSLSVWGQPKQHQQAITATDGLQVWTCVAVNNQGVLTTGLTISTPEVKLNEQGQVVVTATCEGAAVMGVQYLSDVQELADTYVAEAFVCLMENGQAVLTNVIPGSNLTLRVFAANMADAIFGVNTADGFQFSRQVTWKYRKPFSVSEGAADAVYTGKPYRTPITLPRDAAVTYTGKTLTPEGKPVIPGKYVMHVTIPEGDAEYLPGTVDVPFTIERAVLVIYPEPNQGKIKGTEDPLLDWHAEGLLGEDEVYGELWREEGEEVGNYAFLLDGLEAPDYYHMTLQRGAPTFTILPEDLFFGGETFEKLYPVKQEITRKDGRSLFVMLVTQDSLTVRNSVIGQVVRSTVDDRPASFIPSLSWNREQDLVTLRIQVEPKLNKDKGYATSSDGRLLWEGRYLRLSWLALRNLHNMGVDAVSFCNAGGAVTLPLAPLMGEVFAQQVTKAGGSLKTVRIRLTVDPTVSKPAGLQAVTDGWHVQADVITEQGETDMTSWVEGLTFAADLEEVATTMQQLNSYDEDTFEQQFVFFDSENSTQPKAVVVVPFREDEAEKTPYLQLMHTHRYLLTPVTAPAAMWVTRGVAGSSQASEQKQ